MSPFLLLGFLLAGIMHAFIPGQYYSRFLSGKSFKSVINAALFGIPLPLCSCGVIPTAMSLRREGASKGATTTFLIATPQTGVDSIIATYSLMGLPFTLVRPFAALVTSVFGGALVNITDDDDEKRTEADRDCNGGCGMSEKKNTHSLREKLTEALRYAFIDMMEDIGKWLTIGLIVAGLITVFVPNDMFSIFKGNTLASMLLVVCIAMPMYLCATGSIPVAVALMMKGLTPGAALVLLMAGPACNFASMLVVRKVLGTKTLLTYMSAILFGSISFGHLVDFLQFNEIVDFTANLTRDMSCCEKGDSLFSWICTITLMLLIANATFGKHAHTHDHCEHDEQTRDNAHIYIVEGMNCNHCRKAAEDALRGVEGVTDASVDLASKEAVVYGDADFISLSQAVESIGFELMKK